MLLRPSSSGCRRPLAGLAAALVLALARASSAADITMIPTGGSSSWVQAIAAAEDGSLWLAMVDGAVFRHVQGPSRGMERSIHRCPPLVRLCSALDTRLAASS